MAHKLSIRTKIDIELPSAPVTRTVLLDDKVIGTLQYAGDKLYRANPTGTSFSSWGMPKREAARWLAGLEIASRKEIAKASQK
jgi:hypothetical protein